MPGKEIPIVARIMAKHEGLQRELNAANRKLSRYETQTAKVGKAIQSNLAGAFGLFALQQGASASLSKIANFEFQLDKVEAISGATAKQMKLLEERALELGRTSKFTATQVGELEESLARLGFDTNQILASTNAISKLAIVADSELGESARTVAGTLNSFNLQATQSERVANTMAEAFSKSALDLEKFTVATSNSGAIARVMGVTLEQNTARMGKLVDANIDASKAGTDLRTIYLSLNEAGLTYDEAMNKIVNSSDQAGVAQQLFGRRAAGAAVILANLQNEVKALTDQLSDSNQELDSMVDIMENNLLTDWVKFQSAVDGLVQKGSALNDFLRSGTQWMTRYVNTITSEHLSIWEKYAAVLEQVYTAGNSTYFEETRKSRSETEKFAETQKRLKEQTQANVEAFRIFHQARKQGISSLEDMLRPIEQHILFDEIKLALEERLKMATDRKIESIQKQIQATERLKQAETELKSIQFAQAQLPNVGAPNIGDFKLSDFNLGPSFEEQLEALILTGGEANTALQEEFNNALNESLAVAEDYKNSITAISAELSNTINQTLNQATAAFVAGFVHGGVEEAFRGLALVVAEGLITLGKQLIAFGVAVQAFESAPPGVKIAAGIAAIAAGELVKKAIGNIESSVGRTAAAGYGGSSSGPAGDFIGNANGQSIHRFEVEPVIISGDKLALVLRNHLSNNLRATG